jgi:hypothetical protein
MTPPELPGGGPPPGSTSAQRTTPPDPKQQFSIQPEPQTNNTQPEITALKRDFENARYRASTERAGFTRVMPVSRLDGHQFPLLLQS